MHKYSQRKLLLLGVVLTAVLTIGILVYISINDEERQDPRVLGNSRLLHGMNMSEQAYLEWSTQIESFKTVPRDPDKAVGEPSIYFREDYRVLVSMGPSALEVCARKLEGFIKNDPEAKPHDRFLAYAIIEIMKWDESDFPKPMASGTEFERSVLLRLKSSGH